MQATSARIIEWIEARHSLEPYQRRFLRGAFRPGIRVAALSGPSSPW